MWFRDLFPLDTMYKFNAGKFNHCSSVVGHKKGAFVAWYAGSGECRDDQSVYVTSITDRVNEYLQIGNKTGNPIIWKEFDQYYLLWSKFEDDGQIKSPADRWKHCSLWIQRISPANKWSRIRLIGDPICLSGSHQHLLARCNPVVTEAGFVYLPLYDEYAQECVIYAGKQMEFIEIGRFGSKEIQPTIWFENNILHALCRNFGNSNHWSQHYSTESMSPVAWGPMTNNKLSIVRRGSTRIFNMNSSLHVAALGDDIWVLWNDVRNYIRSKMTLGLITKLGDMLCPRTIEVLQVGKSSYPSMHIDGNRLHITYSAQDGVAYHVKNRRHLERCKRASA